MRRHIAAEDAWFAEMLQPLAPTTPTAHPARAVLYAYLRGRLPDRWLEEQRLVSSPDAWTLTRVSQHLLVCDSCHTELAQMRRAQLRPRWEEIAARLGSPEAVAVHLRTAALAVALLLLLNWGLVIFSPPPPGTLSPCPARPIKSPDKGKDPSMSESAPREATKLELCSNEQPQPAFWQRWWTLWLLTPWGFAILAHISWFLLNNQNYGSSARGPEAAG